MSHVHLKHFLTQLPTSSDVGMKKCATFVGRMTIEAKVSTDSKVTARVKHIAMGKAISDTYHQYYAKIQTLTLTLTLMLY